MRYINRDLEQVVLELSDQYPAILLTGPRQVGKTTMFQKLMEGTHRNYISLDDLNNRELAKNDPEMFFQLHKPPVLIDEVQYAPELFRHIKILIDKDYQPGAFWLTGSQIFKLMSGVQESLAGRVAVLSMSSLSQKEIYGSGTNEPFVIDLGFLRKREKNRKPADTPEIYNRIFKGSMPAIVSGKYKKPNVFYSSYITTYLDRDVKEISGTIESLQFLNFITAAACRCSQMLNVAEIARDADINQVTAKKWLGILETLGITFYLHPYSNNLLKRTIKAPKLYFADSGLVAYLTKWSSPETLESGAMNGAILENYAISEIIKSYYNSALQPFIYYYRNKDAREIDLVLEMDGRLMPMEIKKTAAPGTQLTRVFKALDNASVARGPGAILCMKPELSALDKDNLIVPLWLI